MDRDTNLLDINQNKEMLKPKYRNPKKTKEGKPKKRKVRKLKMQNVETDELTRRQDIPRYLPDQIRSCTLSEVDLIAGLRLLTKIGCHFYPGRLTEISPPDIYGIIIDKERGSKPHIFSREEVIKEAVIVLIIIKQVLIILFRFWK